jgi:uncharacterized protein YgiM (DUF1202 family)
MSLESKYNEVIEMAKYYKVEELAVQEMNGALHVSGKTNPWVKTKLWDAYNKIDPDFASGDMVLNLDAPELEAETKLRIDTKSSNLNIRKGPSTTEDIVGKAAHKEIVTLVNQYDNLWWEIRTDDGEQGYAYTQYLTPVKDDNNLV